MQPINPTSPQLSTLSPEQLSIRSPIGLRPNMSSSSNQIDIAPSVPTAPVKSFTPETFDRPILPPPDFSKTSPPETSTPPTLSELQFLAAMETFRTFANDLLVNLGVRLEGYRLNLQEINTENIKKLKEAAENTQTANMWSLLKKIGASLLSALSVVMGISLIATGAGTLVGGAMIGSGILFLANMLMSEAGIWDWVAKKLAHEDEERQQLLAMLLPCSVGVLAAAIGIFGSAGTFVWSGISFLDKAMMIAQTALVAFDSVNTIGKSYADAKTIWLNADLAEVKEETTIEQQMINKATACIENVLGELKMSHEKSAQFVQMAIRSNQAAVEVFG